MAPAHGTSTSLGLRSGTAGAALATRPTRWLVGLALAALVAVGCASDDEPVAGPDAGVESTGLADTSAAGEPADGQAHPDVIDAVAAQSPDGTWSFDVTISSPYDSAERYADAWRVLAPDGAELGIRVLAHDHANEQPFTRSLSGVSVPDGVDTVIVEGRDLANGWGGQTFELDLPG